MDSNLIYRYSTDGPKAGYLPSQGASSLFGLPTARSGVPMSRRILEQQSIPVAALTSDADQAINARLFTGEPPASGTSKRPSWTREIAVPPRRIGSHSVNRAIAVTALSEAQPVSTSLLKKAVETSALNEGSPGKPKPAFPEVSRRGSLPGRRRSLLTKAQVIPTRGPSLLALYEQRSEQLAELARTAQVIAAPQTEPRRRSRSLPSIHQSTSSTLDACKRDLGITALRGFTWIPDTSAGEPNEDVPPPGDEDSFISFTSESLITPSEDLSMAHLQQSTSQTGHTSLKRPIFSDPFGRTVHSMMPMYEEDEHSEYNSGSPIRKLSVDLELPQILTNRFATMDTRPVMHRYRTAPSTIPASSGLNIVFDNLVGDAGAEQSFWMDRQGRDSHMGSVHSTSPTADLARGFSSVRMTRQTRRLSDSSATQIDAPIIGSESGARSGRFDSVVSWRSKRGSWAAISLVDDGFLEDEGEGDWSSTPQSAALDAVVLPEGGRTRFDSIDTAMRDHQANGGIWGGELAVIPSCSKRAYTSEQVPVNRVRRGTEGALPVYIDMGDRWVKL